MLTLNAVAHSQMMLNATVAQIQQLSRKTPKRKKIQIRFGQSWIKVTWDNTRVEDNKRLCIHHFAWTVVDEKAVFKVGAVFAHSWSRITMHRWFRVLFATKRCFLRKYVTIDETWIHHFTPESNQLSAERTAAGESRPKRLKMQTSAGKVLASVFWDAQGILFVDYLEKRRTINSGYYIALLVRLKEKTPKNGHKRRKRALSPIRCTVSQVDRNDSITTWIALRIASAPILSPDLAPSYYWLFADLKRMLQGKRFGSNEEVISETEAYFEAKDKSLNKKGIELLKKHSNLCITLEGDYVDK